MYLFRSVDEFEGLVLEFDVIQILQAPKGRNTASMMYVAAEEIKCWVLLNPSVGKSTPLGVCSVGCDMNAG